MPLDELPAGRDQPAERMLFPEAIDAPLALDAAPSAAASTRSSTSDSAPGPATADAMPRLDLRSMPEAPGPVAPRHAGPSMPMPVPGSTRWDDYIKRCVAINGALFGCVFDVPTLAPLAHAGGGPAPERLARQGALMLASMSDAARALGLPATPVDAAVTTGGHHLLLRPVPRHPGIALHLVMEGQTNLTLARLQLERVTPPT
jgi:hypothetical protein